MSEPTANAAAASPSADAVIVLPPADVAKPKQTKLKPKRKKNDMTWSPSASHPRGKKKIELQSEYAKRVFEDGYERTTHSLYELEVMLRVLSLSEKETDIVEKRVNERFAETESDLEQEIEQMQTLVDQQKQRGNIIEIDGYTKPYVGEAIFYSPQSGRYLKLIQRMDNLMGLIDQLWMLNVLNPKQRFNGTIGWQRRLMEFGRELQKLHLRARGALEREKIAERKRDQDVASKAAAEKAASTVATASTATDDATTSDPFGLASSETLAPKKSARKKAAAPAAATEPAPASA